MDTGFRPAPWAACLGGLLGSLAVAAAQPRPAAVSYRFDVMPVLTRAGCNQGTCHGNLTGKGGFRLSLRGDDPVRDLALLTRDALGRRINRAEPAQSLLLRKPAGQLPHEGGKRFAAGSPEYETLRRWIAAGATDDPVNQPHVVRLVVAPAERVLPFPQQTQPLTVVAEFSNGRHRTVTTLATFETSEPTKVTVAPDGLVKVRNPVEVAVTVRYATARAVCRLAFLPQRAGFTWHDEPLPSAIDRAVFAKLNVHRIEPAPPADDSTFLRRAYLVALGRLPTVAETRAFLASPAPAKREALADRLVEQPEFAEFWALKWADVLRNEEKTMSPIGVWKFHRWLEQQLQADVPLDQFARQLVATLGSTWDHPAASFYRTNRDPTVAAEAVAQVFLGYRLQCARCHNHPFDVWTQNDYYGLAAFFANIQRQEFGNARKDKFDKHEINGDERIFLKGQPALRHPTQDMVLRPKPLGRPAVPVPANGNALDALADWLTHDPQFARNLANRIWYHLLGRGVVDPPDDFRDSNPPSNPELLDVLTAELGAHGMRLKPTVASILKSRTFQARSRPRTASPEDETNFACYAERMVPAEVLFDAVCQVLETPAAFDDAPPMLRAVQLPGARMGGRFLKVFGKPNRLLTCECERIQTNSLGQAFQLLNGPDIRQRLEAKNNRIGRLLAARRSTRQIIAEFYLAALARLPAADEAEALMAYIDRQPDRRQGTEDVVWSLLASKEFLLLH